MSIIIFIITTLPMVTPYMQQATEGYRNEPTVFNYTSHATEGYQMVTNLHTDSHRMFPHNLLCQWLHHTNPYMPARRSQLHGCQRQNMTCSTLEFEFKLISCTFVCSSFAVFRLLCYMQFWNPWVRFDNYWRPLGHIFSCPHLFMYIWWWEHKTNSCGLFTRCSHFASLVPMHTQKI